MQRQRLLNLRLCSAYRQKSVHTGAIGQVMDAFLNPDGNIGEKALKDDEKCI